MTLIKSKNQNTQVPNFLRNTSTTNIVVQIARRYLDYKPTDIPHGQDQTLSGKVYKMNTKELKIV